MIGAASGASIYQDKRDIVWYMLWCTGERLPRKLDTYILL
jgi:hypothetical protein